MKRKKNATKTILNKDIKHCFLYFLETTESEREQTSLS